mgnify:CR=1 FL=1
MATAKLKRKLPIKTDMVGHASPGRWRASKDFFKCREFAGSATAECVTAGFIFLRRCLSDLEPREKTKAPPSTAVFR